VAAGELTLYVNSRFTSPYAMAVFVTLHEKKLPFSLKTLDLSSKQQYGADYAALSLSSRVPTLVDGDFSLSESSAICEYLEEKFSAPKYAAVYPKNIQDRARARQIQAWIRSDFMPIREERSTEVIFFKPTDTPLSQKAQESAAMLFAAADKLIHKGEKNLFGEWCIADTDLAVLLNRLVMNGDKVPEKLAEYAKHQWQRPSVQLWVKQNRK
jgi:glutathione S-transferase